MRKFQVRYNQDYNEYDIIYFDDDNKKVRYSDDVYYSENDAIIECNNYESINYMPVHWDVFRNY